MMAHAVHCPCPNKVCLWCVSRVKCHREPVGGGDTPGISEYQLGQGLPLGRTFGSASREKRRPVPASRVAEGPHLRDQALQVQGQRSEGLGSRLIESLAAH